MPYILIENFASGVDRRRPISVGQSGSLWEGINGHITRGGDFEKAKAFFAKYTIPANTFGLESASGTLHIFGSVATPIGVPAEITYHRLQHPDGLAMTKILSTDLFDGLIYVIAQYSDNSIFHFYNDALITDWGAGVVRANMTGLPGIATELASIINADPLYTASNVGEVITITETAIGAGFTIVRETENVSGGTDDQDILLATPTPNIPNVSEALAVGSFDITGGTFSAGVNEVSGIKIDGIEIMSGGVDWTTSNSGTATLVAANITANTSSPNYNATAVGSTVNISAVAGSGASPNGFTVAVTVAGNVTIASIVDMGGGVTAATGQAQISTATVIGSFEVGDKYNIELSGVQFGYKFMPDGKGDFAKTYRSKVYSLNGSLFEFCEINTPSRWNSNDDIGAGFINMANQDAGSEDLTSIEVYQGNLAVFSQNVIQIWSIREDDANNTHLQTLRRTGTDSPKSVVSFGDVDVFYLHSTGVRSLRARDSSNSASVNDVGTLIDPLIIEDFLTLTTQQIEDAVADIELSEGRFWLVLGGKVYVFSYFPASKISAWTWYEPGFEISDLALIGKRIYARSEDTVYLYGGDDNNTFDSSKATCWLPFATAEKPGHGKFITGVDIAAENIWDCTLLLDPNDLAQVSHVGELEDTTFNDQNSAGVGLSSHVSVKLECTQPGKATVSQAALYYNEGVGES